MNFLNRYLTEYTKIIRLSINKTIIGKTYGKTEYQSIISIEYF